MYIQTNLLGRWHHLVNPLILKMAKLVKTKRLTWPSSEVGGCKLGWSITGGHRSWPVPTVKRVIRSECSVNIKHMLLCKIGMGHFVGRKKETSLTHPKTLYTVKICVFTHYTRVLVNNTSTNCASKNTVCEDQHI